MRGSFIEMYSFNRNASHSSRGLSSTVRRCVSRETGREYAVKIIDKAQDEAIKESIDAEVHILSTLPRHPNISKCREGREGGMGGGSRRAQTLQITCRRVPIVSLEDVFESPAFIFLVFEL